MFKLTLILLLVGYSIAGEAISPPRTLSYIRVLTLQPVPTPTPTDKQRAEAFVAKIKERNPHFKCSFDQKTLEGLALSAYGAVFVSTGATNLPTCLFTSEEALDTFQNKPNGLKKTQLNGIDYSLQSEAAESLEKVFSKLGGFKMVARNHNSDSVEGANELNADWAIRTLRQTQCNWIGEGKDEQKCEQRIRDKPERITAKSVLNAVVVDSKRMFSYAIPGASQHHFGLAIDVNDARNGNLDCKERCTGPLNENGWWRTVPGDKQHFTYLGHKSEKQLEDSLLRKITCDGVDYWIPDLRGEYQNRYITDSLDKKTSQKNVGMRCTW